MEGAPTSKLDPRTEEIEGEGGRHGTKELGTGDKTRTVNSDNSYLLPDPPHKAPCSTQKPENSSLIQALVTTAGEVPPV